jgi:N-acetylneuraminic acid mutarotase
MDTWTQKADLPGIARMLASAFVVSGRAYVVTGIDSAANMLGEVWEYDPASDAWAQKNDFAGTPRFFAEGFSIGNKGYITTGWDTTQHYRNDLWEYDAVADSWTEMDTIPSFGRKSMSSFVVDGNAYIVSGVDENGTRLKQTWAYGSTVGVEESAIFPAAIYPNPCKDVLTLRKMNSGLFGEETVLSIRNLLGEEVQSVYLPDGQQTITLVTSGLSKGIYLLTINDPEHGSFSSRFVKE